MYSVAEKAVSGYSQGLKLGVVVRACNSSTWEEREGEEFGSAWAAETLSQKQSSENNSLVSPE